MKNKKTSGALNAALKYLSYRPRTTQETKMYLEKKRFSDGDISSAITVLKGHNFLNDADFCSRYLEYHSEYKPKSTFAMGYDLKKKGICQSIIDKYIHAYDNNVLAVKCVKTRMQRWQNLDTDKLKNKVFNYLRYRGFNFQTCQTVYERVLNGDFYEN